MTRTGGRPAGGVRVSVVYRPVAGPAARSITQTSSSGRFQVAVLVTTNGVVDVVTGATPSFGATSVGVHVSVEAAATCHLASLHVKAPSSDTGVCHAPLVPSGTVASVQYESNHVWKLASQETFGANGYCHFQLDASGGGRTTLRVVIDQSRLFAQTIVSLGTLVVTG